MPITNYSVNNSGQALLSIEAQEDKYYVLTSQHSPTFEWATSVNIGVNGTMIISDPGNPILLKIIPLPNIILLTLVISMEMALMI